MKLSTSRYGNKLVKWSDEKWIRSIITHLSLAKVQKKLTKKSLKLTSRVEYSRCIVDYVEVLTVREIELTVSRL